MASAEREPITGSWAEQPVGFRGRAPGQGVRRRSLPKSKSFEAFVRLKKDPKLAVNKNQDRFNMDMAASKQMQSSVTNWPTYTGPSFLLGPKLAACLFLAIRACK